jgi:tRNA(Ser,Leu) C12 N-acetylase TAN1
MIQPALRMQDSYDWNIVVTVRPRGYRRTWAGVGRLGVPRQTDFWNVLVMQVEDPRGFLVALEAMVGEDKRLAGAISHVVASTHTFHFHTQEEFERRASEIAREFVSALKGAAFHVRMHRRGLKELLSSQSEEQFLDHFILERLEEAGAPGRITFEDPDYIVALESVGTQAGMSLWSREDLKRFQLLGLD